MNARGLLSALQAGPPTECFAQRGGWQVRAEGFYWPSVSLEGGGVSRGRGLTPQAQHAGGGVFPHGDLTELYADAVRKFTCAHV